MSALGLEGIAACARAAVSSNGGVWESREAARNGFEVAEPGRDRFGLVAVPNRRSTDRGRAVAEYIAAVDPVTVLALLERLRLAEIAAKPPF